MKFFNNMKISVKLPLVVASAGSLMLVIVGAVSHMSARDALMDEGSKKLELAMASSKSDLEKQLNTLVTQATSPLMRQAIVEFRDAWVAIPGDKAAYLEEAYITNNPNSPGKRHLMAYAPDRSSYSRTHRKYHGFFRNMAELNGIGDVSAMARRAGRALPPATGRSAPKPSMRFPSKASPSPILPPTSPPGAKRAASCRSRFSPPMVRFSGCLRRKSPRPGSPDPSCRPRASGRQAKTCSSARIS